MYAPDGELVWQRTLGRVDLELGMPLEVPVDAVAGGTSADAGPARAWQVVDEGELDALLQLVMGRSARGFCGHDEADWITADLDELEHQLSLDVIEGSLSNLDAIGRILRGSPPWSRLMAGSRHRRSAGWIMVASFGRATHMPSCGWIGPDGQLGRSTLGRPRGWLVLGSRLSAERGVLVRDRGVPR